MRQFNRRAVWAARMLRLAPWVKMVGISGGLAIENVTKKDDIDLFVVTEVGRLWISRLLVLGILGAVGFRRKRTDSTRQAAGKVCVNIVVDTANLAQQSKDIYMAHEVLQMRLLWQRNEVYSKFLNDNVWAIELLPNWTASQKFKVGSPAARVSRDKNNFVDWLEGLSRIWQLKIMSPVLGQERVENGALYFHPLDYKDQILAKFKQKIKAI